MISKIVELAVCVTCKAWGFLDATSPWVAGVCDHRFIREFRAFIWAKKRYNAQRKMIMDYLSRYQPQGLDCTQRCLLAWLALRLDEFSRRKELQGSLGFERDHSETMAKLMRHCGHRGWNELPV